ncbi:phage terminase large subunit family protein [Cytobacillus firmus]|uniref:Uncharacterized protein n=2 Tax=Cytobacillus firmus TaxID=1399 RepID=A0A800NDV6_CYTFI|nr:phage terminase large subunit family protein [Cytobacillus firmus]KAF0825111.1 hypothetical protein KIS1582_1124 [Cytobacillus firmus]MDD9310269.1 hypothetical protein [Cytobacillus firmus]MED1939010.1 hypothetical protein [Cytobacillus firmus]
MGKESQKRIKRKKNKKKKEDFGTCEFHCKHCSHTFEMDWETIWDLQEMTHGYTGFHTDDTFISCPKCDRLIDDGEDEVFFPGTAEEYKKMTGA